MNTIESKGIARKIVRSTTHVYFQKKLQQDLARGWQLRGDIRYDGGLYEVCLEMDISRKNQMKKEVRT